jgi:polyisoprenoid-binding protein YceI
LPPLAAPPPAAPPRPPRGHDARPAHVAPPVRLRVLARLALLSTLAGGPAAARPAEAAPLDLGVRPGSTLSYRLVHKLHEVTGVSQAVEGKARLLPDGAVQVVVRAKVETFDSGNGNRDAHMLEATEAARFPFVTLKAVGALQPPAAYPASVKVTLRGELTFHGVARPVEVPVEVAFASARQATATAKLPISLDAHGVERPSLLFVKVDDAVVVTASLSLAAEGP